MEYFDDRYATPVETAVAVARAAVTAAREEEEEEPVSASSTGTSITQSPQLSVGLRTLS